MSANPKLALKAIESKQEYKGIGTSIYSWDKTKWTPKIITKKQYHKIRYEIYKHNKCSKGIYYQTLFDIGRYSGMRLSEALRIRIGDINFKERYILIKQQKNGRPRDCQPIPRILCKQIMEGKHKGSIIKW